MVFDEIYAAPQWQRVDFISDLHLQESEPANFLAWRSYLEQSSADAIFILGDLFEVWIGDDASKDTSIGITSTRHMGLRFEDRCCRILHFCAQHRNVYFMHGNRDFLVGAAFANACGMQIVSDPSVLIFGDQRYLLSHGDALCLADEPYQKFRAMVRSDAWQAKFLATPVHERMSQAREMRAASQARQKELFAAGQSWIDLDQKATVQWMDAAQAQHVIHGHTHEGRDHRIASRQGHGMRHALPDWCVAASHAQPARGYALRLSLDEINAVQAQHIPVM